MVGSITSEVAQEILKQRNEVVAEKVKAKRGEQYVEKNRRWLDPIIHQKYLGRGLMT